MKKIFMGAAYVLGDDVDTDQIIPAHHLVYDLDNPEERKLYGAYALSGVPAEQAGLPQKYVPFIPAAGKKPRFSVVIAGKNFGCGSSREHAPVALSMAGVEVVVASSYARIFYRNSVDGGYFIPYECYHYLPDEISTNDLVEVDKVTNMLRNMSTGREYVLKPLGEVDEIVTAGGIFGYSRKHGLMK